MAKNKINTGRLFLIPSMLGDTLPGEVLPEEIRNRASQLKYFIVEELRTARRFLKKLDKSTDIDALQFFVLNEHTDPAEIPGMLKPLADGLDMGLLSEAGMPCIADPGSGLVSAAHAHGIRVIPLSGPSSISLALAASGFNGQNFAFHGYLPIEEKKRIQAIRNLEHMVYRNDQTQIFIETPYRNMKMFESLLQACRPESMLCIAANITTSAEMIRSRSIAQWNKEAPDIHKKPVVFLLYK